MGEALADPVGSVGREGPLHHFVVPLPIEGDGEEKPLHHFVVPLPIEGDGEDRVVVAARGWLGTPYRHQASVRGQGADCLGLVRGVWREVMGIELETVPPYTPDWAETGGREELLEAAGRWLTPVPVEAMAAGDVVLFRMSPGCVVKHCAILSEVEGPEPRMIHAYWGRAVVESWMGPWWMRRRAAVFRFPVSLPVEN